MTYFYILYFCILYFSSNITPAEVRSMTICGGNNLQIRKNLLIENVDAIVTLPGGVGTWEELWEAVVTLSHQLDKNMKIQEIIIINVDGFYDGFVQQLKRAEKEGTSNFIISISTLILTIILILTLPL